jgi:hypothetical protein
MTPRAVTTSIIRSVNNYPTSTYKSTTGLVGIEVDFDARNTLLDLTAQCLQSVQVCHSFHHLRESDISCLICSELHLIVGTERVLKNGCYLLRNL